MVLNKYIQSSDVKLKLSSTKCVSWIFIKHYLTLKQENKIKVGYDLLYEF